MSIVVIEDRHAQHAYFLRRHFERIGLEVCICTTHVEALALLQQQAVSDLVIDLDESDPFQLLELRKVYSGPLTGWSSLPSTRTDSRVRACCTQVYDMTQLMRTTASDFVHSLTKVGESATVAN